MTEMLRAVPQRPVSPTLLGHEALSDSLRQAASRGQLDLVRELLSKGSGLEPDRDGRNALHYAAQEGHADVCKFLVAAGCDVNQQDVMGKTPLLRAASQGVCDAMQVLLEAGCDVDRQDEQGNTAIHEACWNGFSTAAKLLVKHNCDVFITNKAGFTALHLAAQNGHNESSRVLLYAGCDADLKNNYGDTALHTSARYGHAGVARILISARCKLSEQNKNGDTPLHIAAALKRRKIAKILVESGIDVDVVNKQNERAIDVAKRKEHPEIMLIISSYAKPRLNTLSRSQGEMMGISFKDDIDAEDGPVVCAEEELPLKSESKQEKEGRRFFFFKKKKKEKEKPPTLAPGQKKSGPQLFPSSQTKPAVHGFFSQYVPRDGVQLYRDLAGNIKQGPIGYAPVCQCGPSLKRLEHSITDTRDSLYSHMDVSHQILSQRIENLDIRTKQQAHNTEAMVQERFRNEEHACHGRISSRLHEERLETQALLNQASHTMKDQLEYWLNDKLASYGHCLDHHHDDSALPPRNLFSDFSPMGQLIRSRSDETLTASDYSGKFRKKDFYASRQAAMQQIRGWDVPVVDNSNTTDRARRRERNNNSALTNNNNKILVQAQVHAKSSDRVGDTFQHNQYSKISSSNPDVLSPSTNSTTSPGTYSSTTNVGSVPGTTPVNVGAKPQRELFPHRLNQDAPRRDMRSKSIDRSGLQHRVTFSTEQQPPQRHFQHPSIQRVSSPSPVGVPRGRMDPANLGQQRSSRLASPTSQHPSQPPHPSQSNHPNLNAGGPPNTDTKSGEQGGSRMTSLTGQTTGGFKGDNSDKRQSDYNNGSLNGGQQKLTRYQGASGVHYNRPRTLSTDSIMLEDYPPSSSQHITRSHSVENTLDEKDTRHMDIYNSGYITDSAIRPSSGGSSSNRYIQSQRNFRDAHSSSPAARPTTRYRIPETSADASPNRADAYNMSLYMHSQSSKVPPSLQAQHSTLSPAMVRTFNSKGAEPLLNVPRSVSYDNSTREQQPVAKTQQKSLNNLTTSGNPRPAMLTNFEKSDSVRYAGDQTDATSKSEGNLNASQTPHFRAPVKECLQHNTLVSPATSPTPLYVAGNKEDSTCSSNQDSGYGSRNHGGVKGVDTSGGTPSSSFSMERSACNTPSNTGSPYTTQGEVITQGFPKLISDRLSQSYGSPQSYSPVAVQYNSSYIENNRSLNSSYKTSGSERDIPDTRQQTLNTNSNTPKLPLRNPYTPSPNPNSNLPSRNSPFPQSSSTQQSMPRNPSSLGPGNTPDYNSVERASFAGNSTQQGVYRPFEKNSKDIQCFEMKVYSTNQQSSSANQTNQQTPSAYQTNQQISSAYQTNQQSPSVYQTNQQTPSVYQTNQQSSSVYQTNQQSPAAFTNPLTRKESVPFTPLQAKFQAPQLKSQNGSPRPADSVPQAAVQAHIEGWYQRKVMEAAQRLRQNQSYNEPSMEENEEDIYSTSRNANASHSIYGSGPKVGQPSFQGSTADTRQTGKQDDRQKFYFQHSDHRQINYQATAPQAQQPSSPQPQYQPTAVRNNTVPRMASPLTPSSTYHRQQYSSQTPQGSHLYENPEASRASGYGSGQGFVREQDSFYSSNRRYSVDRTAGQLANTGNQMTPQKRVAVRYDPVNGSDV